GPSGAGTFTYYADGNMASRSDAGSQTTFFYQDGRLSAAVTGTKGWNYFYDYAGRLSQINDWAPSTAAPAQLSTSGPVDQPLCGGCWGSIQFFDYDSLGRLKGISADAGSVSVSYGYDGEDHLTSRTSTGLAGPAAESFAYDRTGRLTSR